jgi:hypothetical protein
MHNYPAIKQSHGIEASLDDHDDARVSVSGASLLAVQIGLTRRLPAQYQRRKGVAPVAVIADKNVNIPAAEAALVVVLSR